jgi:hypothetical protein
VDKRWITANTNVKILAFLFAFVAAGCSHEPTKTMTLPTPHASTLSSPCSFFADMYPVTRSSFIAHHATAKERNEILRWYATVSIKNRKYVRWMRKAGPIVFVANPDYNRSGYGAYAWMAMNTNMIVDPVRCVTYATSDI